MPRDPLVTHFEHVRAQRWRHHPRCPRACQVRCALLAGILAAGVWAALHQGALTAWLPHLHALGSG